jgi:protein TonB
MMKQVITLSAICFLFSFNGFAQAAPVDTTKKIATVKNTSSGKDALVWTKVEQEASFPGGNTAWNNYLEKNIHRNIVKQNKAPKGKYLVVVKFVVNAEGEIYNAVCETKYGYGIEEEVIKVVEQSPKWTPAMRNRKLVDTHKSQSIPIVIE